VTSTATDAAKATVSTAQSAATTAVSTAAAVASSAPLALGAASRDGSADASVAGRSSSSFLSSSLLLSRDSWLDPTEWTQLLQEEVARPAYSIDDDYMDVLLQFGYFSLFAVIFPLAPMLAYFTNFVEGNKDIHKLSRCRRSPLVKRGGIMAWQSCLEFLSFACVCTNCFLLVKSSSHMHTITPPLLHQIVDSEHYSLICLLVMGHVLMALKSAITYVIDEVPIWVKEALARKRIQLEEGKAESRLAEYTAIVQNRLYQRMAEEEEEEEKQAEERRQLLQQEEEDESEQGGGIVGAVGGLLGGIQSAGAHTLRNPISSIGSGIKGTIGTSMHAVGRIGSGLSSAMGVDHLLGRGINRGDACHYGAAMAVSAADMQRQLLAKSTAEAAIAHIAQQQHSKQFGFDPLSMMLLFGLPPLLFYSGISPFLYLPAALLFFSYLQAMKNRDDRKAAIGIISDPALLKLGRGTATTVIS